MTGLYGSSDNPRLVGLVLVCGLAIGATAALAGPRNYVLRDGRTVELMRSDSEFAVELDCVDSSKACARRLASKGVGIITGYPGVPNSRFKILRVADASAGKRALVRQDAAIRSVRAVYRFPGADDPLLATGILLVRVQPDLTDDELAALWSTYRVRVIEPVEGLGNTYALAPLDPEEDEVLRAEAMALDRRTVWAHPNFRRRAVLAQALPGDEFFAQQWYLNNTGQGGGTSGADISVLGAWLISQGQDIRIGMYDDACDVKHPDLVLNYIGVGNDPSLSSNQDGFDDPSPKQIGDRHGTAVMGLAVAVGNTIGVRGVAFRSRFTASRGRSGLQTDQQDVAAFTFARQRDVQVHINSWGYGLGNPAPPIVEDAIDTAFLQGRDPDGLAGAEPALGMVIVFAQGNTFNSNDVGAGVEVEPGSAVATLDSVIAVGASTAQDTLASYSNYGRDMEFLAPGGGDIVDIFTTDNDDSNAVIEDGFNRGGFPFDCNPDVDSNCIEELDQTGRYTSTFFGTSASCPIVAGVAALMLSANQSLTATDVRVILEHACDRISPDDAGYDNVTGKSLRYGYGRVNAEAAVNAANDALDNGGRTWPRPATSFVKDGTDLTWKAGIEADEFLIVESDGDFTFAFDVDAPFPKDLVCYSPDQIGCSVAPIEPLPAGVRLTGVSACKDEPFSAGDTCLLSDKVRDGVAYAIFGRSGIGRYSWGIEAVEAGSAGGPAPGTAEGPNVTIRPSITSGSSPLTVRFTGNAERTSADIDGTRAEWDFDLDDGILVDATTRNAEHTYVVGANEVRTFIARLTMFDVNGMPGVAQVTIRVEGATDGDFVPGGTSSSVRIVVGLPGSIDSDVDTGVSPFSVLLSVDATTLVGDLQSIEWDMGDGTSSTSLVVPHTFINTSDQDLRIPVTARVTTQTSATTTQVVTAERIVTVRPEEETVELPPTPSIPGAGVPGGGGGAGGGASSCGALGLLPLVGCFGLLPLMRYRRRTRRVG